MRSVRPHATLEIGVQAVAPDGETTHASMQEGALTTKRKPRLDR